MTSRTELAQTRNAITKECEALDIGLQVTVCTMNAFKTKALDPYHSSYDKAYFSTKNMYAIFKKIIENHLPTKIAALHIKINQYTRMTRSSSQAGTGSLVSQLNHIEQKLSQSQNLYLSLKEFSKENHKSSVWDRQFKLNPETLYSDLTYYHVILHWDMYTMMFVINALYNEFKDINGSSIGEIGQIVHQISHCLQHFDLHVPLVKKIIDEQGVEILTSDQVNELSKNHIHSTNEDLLILHGQFEKMANELRH